MFFQISIYLKMHSDIYVALLGDRIQHKAHQPPSTEIQQLREIGRGLLAWEGGGGRAEWDARRESARISSRTSRMWSRFLNSALPKRLLLNVKGAPRSGLAHWGCHVAPKLAIDLKATHISNWASRVSFNKCSHWHFVSPPFRSTVRKELKHQE